MVRFDVICITLCLDVLAVTNGFTLVTERCRQCIPSVRSTSLDVRRSPTVWSSFYGNFDGDEEEDEDDEDDEEDDDDDDFDDLNDAAVASFRSKMSSLFGETTEEASQASSVDDLIRFARSQSKEGSEVVVDWATEAQNVGPGVVLVANPAKFCNDFGNSAPSPTLLAKFGLTLPPPTDLGPDRRADLLPVLIVVDNGRRALLLNRRTGYLLGDLEQPGKSGENSPPAPLLEKFCIQPLYFGGVDYVSSGLEMLHQCPAVIGAERLTEDGLYWGGDPAQAQDAMSDPTLDRVMTGFDFKFFVQCTMFAPGELEKEIKAGTWFLAKVSKEVLFKPRDRMGTRRAKPLWTEIMELLGGDYEAVRDKLYSEGSM